jgi:transcriptional regulator GlxA family with amidase domain
MLLAAAGLTAGRRVTTDHDALEDLRAPGARVVADARAVDDGDLPTTAGMTAGLDLSLWIDEQASGLALADAGAAEIEYWRLPDVHRLFPENK